jgi:hypothetical protein
MDATTTGKGKSNEDDVTGTAAARTKAALTQGAWEVQQ